MADAICIRSECEHPARFHTDDRCRVTACTCEELRVPEPEVAKVPSTRRVCIDVPDGYSLSVSLIPFTESQSEAE